jgi:hypothetical protein
MRSLTPKSKANSSPVAPSGVNLYEGFVSLVESGLRASAVKLADMAFGLHEAGHRCFSQGQLNHSYQVVADYYLEKEEYILAERYYNLLIDHYLFRKSDDDETHFFTVTLDSIKDWQWKRARCLVGMGKEEEAVRLLTSIPLEYRTTRINMLLGELHRRRGCPVKASSNFR